MNVLRRAGAWLASALFLSPEADIDQDCDQDYWQTLEEMVDEDAMEYTALADMWAAHYLGGKRK